MTDVLAGIRDAAASTRADGPHDRTTGDVRPVSPVIYLEVGGEVHRVHQLRDALHDGPLARPARARLRAGVTIDEDCPPERIEDVMRVLAGYEIEVRLDSLHLFAITAPGRDDGTPSPTRRSSLRWSSGRGVCRSRSRCPSSPMPRSLPCSSRTRRRCRRGAAGGRRRPRAARRRHGSRIRRRERRAVDRSDR